jgi:acetyltransferase-like isoleucine patch superfamily enzyme/acyl carrier protein
VKTLYLCGVGNAEGIRLALRVNQAQQRWERIRLLDDDPAKRGLYKLGLEIAGPFDLLGDADSHHDEVVNLVTRTTDGRAKARARIAQFGIPFASLIHSDVDLLGVELGDEVTVYPMASLGAEARVERSSVVLVGGLVGHGAQVGEGCIVAPHAVVNARVQLGAGVYVGSNASILPDLTIGAGATIAANTVVFSDVPAGATAIGVPAAIMAGVATGSATALQRASAGPGPEPGSADVGALEGEIAEVVRQVLGLDTVARHANFFDLGGTSLKALQVCQQLRDLHGFEVQLLDLYRCPSVQALAVRLSGAAPDAGPAHQAQQRAALRRQRARR